MCVKEYKRRQWSFILKLGVFMTTGAQMYICRLGSASREVAELLQFSSESAEMMKYCQQLW